MAKNDKPVIGFIGQGYIGKNYADDYENRGYEVVRYSLEPQYVGNKDRIKDCDIVFIAVWTPTTPKGFDLSIVESVIKLAREGATVVLKSTVLPGSTVRLQKKFPKLVLMYSPEFLSVNTAAQDAQNPFSNIIGIPVDDAKHKVAAQSVLETLPKAPFTLICKSNEAEVIKYSHNMSAFTQIITFNLLYDISKNLKGDWNVIHQALIADPYISNRYAQPIHKSGRGAGGGCFIKDFAAFRSLYVQMMPKDKAGTSALKGFEQKNIQLLTSTKKDLDLLAGVYGKKIAKGAKKVAIGRSAASSKKR